MLVGEPSQVLASAEQLDDGQRDIRRVVNLRLKGNSIYWREPRAEAMLQIRAQVLTGRWDQRLAELRQLMSHDRRTAWHWTPQDMSSHSELTPPPSLNP